MTEVERNKAMMERFYQEFWNKGNVDYADEIMVEDLIHDQLPSDWPKGREGFKRLVATWRAGFSDLNEDVEFVMGDGDRVMSRFTLTGTHDGTFYGIEPTGRRVEIQGVDVARIENGRIVEYFYHEDTLGLFRQLGAFPADTNEVAGTVGATWSGGHRGPSGE